MRFVISASSDAEFPLDRGRYRAFIYSQEGEDEVKRSFTQNELIAEIAHLTQLGQSTAYYARALQCLQLLNGPTKHLPGMEASPVTRHTERAMQVQSR